MPESVSKEGKVEMYSHVVAVAEGGAAPPAWTGEECGVRSAQAPREQTKRTG